MKKIIYIFLFIFACMEGYHLRMIYEKRMQQERKIERLKAAVYEYTIPFEKKVIKDGDIYSYQNLSNSYHNVSLGSQGEMMLYALVMAEKFHFPDAYLDFYTSTVRVLALQQLFIEGENIHQYVDSLTFVQGLSYLRQGAELGNEDAAKKLKQLEDEER